LQSTITGRQVAACKQDTRNNGGRNGWDGDRRAHLTEAETGFKFSSTVLINRGFMAVVAKKRR
jgi:hypothetical protein